MANANRRPITDADRDRLFALHSDGLSRNQIAKEMGRGPSTVSKLAKEAGLSFESHRTAEAVEARVADARAKRAALAVKLLDDAELLRQRLHNRYTVWRIGSEGDLYTGTLELPDARDQRDLMVAAGTAIDKSLRLDEYDADTGIAGAKSMLDALAAGLGEAYERLNPPPPPDGS